MKISRLSRAAGVLLSLALVGLAAPADASTYWTPAALLKDFFLTSTRVSSRSVTLPDAAVAEIGKKLGVPLGKKTWTVYVAEDASQTRLGYAVLDAQIGLHEDIDYGVRFGVGGAVERVEVMVYREPYGDQVRNASFRNQFTGKTASDPITAGQDIAIVSGASYSSKGLALGIKRDTLVLQAALKIGIP